MPGVGQLHGGDLDVVEGDLVEVLDRSPQVGVDLVDGEAEVDAAGDVAAQLIESALGNNHGPSSSPLHGGTENRLSERWIGCSTFAEVL